MKLPKFKNTIFAAAVAISGLIAVFSYSLAADRPAEAGSSFEIPVPKLESLEGTTEFNFVPVNDNRVWHIVNKYTALESNDGPYYNTSSYFFGKDSVCVINEYAGVPEQNPWDISLAQSISNANSFHN